MRLTKKFTRCQHLSYWPETHERARMYTSSSAIGTLVQAQMEVCEWNQVRNSLAPHRSYHSPIGSEHIYWFARRPYGCLKRLTGDILVCDKLCVMSRARADYDCFSFRQQVRHCSLYWNRKHSNNWPLQHIIKSVVNRSRSPVFIEFNKEMLILSYNDLLWTYKVVNLIFAPRVSYLYDIEYRRTNTPQISN